MEKDLVEESRRVAEKIVKGELRLAMAKNYLLSSTFPLVLYALSYFDPWHPVLNFLAVLIGYFYYDIKAFAHFSRAISRIMGKEKAKNMVINRRNIISLLWWEISMIVLGVGVYYRDLSLVLIALSSFAVYFALVVYYLFKDNLASEDKFFDLRYYDLLAWSVLVGTLVYIGFSYSLHMTRPPEIAWIPYTLAWVYAGYASFMEVIEGE
ncbi:hypothetical protein [Stygiolobus caldivivus]|uniref:Uncharacterized protein n=1 Tax=Stygiolobus caldivivus TaxID=2824673 RepID=A0A8D5ZIH9_9CREN|nr:hypothetical protein [Stygiolobus caldivivus]BCU69631.1 hypothetical protein KN1_09280 [Stygiolobus caldivivus]